VHVVDTTPPVMTLSGSASISITKNSTYSESGANWTDTLDGTGVLLSASSGSVDTSVVGAYTLEYSYVDVSGNPSNTVTRIVNVIL